MGTITTTRPDDGDAPADIDEAPPPAVPPRILARLRRPYLIDCAVALGFLVAALWLTHGLWPDPATRQLALNPADQTLIEWFLAVDTRILLGEHGMVTDRLNAPAGVNLLLNASSLTLGLLLAPVTLTLGAPVSFALLTAGNLAATATGWYLLFARTFRAGRANAAVGGALCGFGPAMVSQSNSHWHIAAQWLVPAIVWSVVRLVRAAAPPPDAGRAAATPTDPATARPADPGATTSARAARVLSSALWLAGLVVLQFFLGVEILYLTAVTLALVAVAYALMRPRWTWRVLPGFAAGMLVATGVAGLALGYPLWLQLAGPGGATTGPFTSHYFSADLASWVHFSPLTVAGSDAAAALSTGPAEYNTFLGWPLLVVAALCVVALLHRRLVLATGVAALVMGAFSLGPELIVDDVPTGVTMPFSMLLDRPVIDGALPQRYALAVLPLVATILVLALAELRARPRPLRLAGAAVVAVALLPLLPTPLPTERREPVPAFISDGHWRGCQVLVPVPLPTPQDPEPMRWAAAANAEFALPGGFFIGAYGADGGAAVGAPPRPTTAMLAQVAADGVVPPIGPLQRRQAMADLAFWGAGCVVLRPDAVYEEELRSVLTGLLGPGDRVADVWVWRVYSR